MTEFSKNQLLEQLNDIFQIVTLVYASITYFYRDTDLRILSENNAMYHQRLFRFKDLANELRDEVTRTGKLQEFSWTVEKFLLREPYGAIDEYCRINKIQPDLERQEWWDFARKIRNYVTHNYFALNQNKEECFPVKWKNNEITWNEVKNSSIDFSKFEKGMPMDLYEEIKQFAESLPDN